MVLRRLKPMLVLLVLLTAGTFACTIPSPQARTPTLPTLEPRATATPYVATATPLLPAPAPTEGMAELTWIATEMTRGTPHEGWVEYTVRLAVENNSSEWLWTTLRPVEVQTEEGYSYPALWRSGGRDYDSDLGCEWPSDALGNMDTGLIPPGFRIWGRIGYGEQSDEECVAQLVLTFTIGETLHPTSFTIASLTKAPDTTVNLQEQPAELDYPLIDRGQTFESLPHTIQMGEVWITISQPRPDRDGSTILVLACDNRDPGQSHLCYDPIDSVIDSRGVITNPDPFGSACPHTVPLAGGEELGPLQQGEYQTCVDWDPQGPRFPLYILATGYSGVIDPSTAHRVMYEVRDYWPE